METRTRHSRKFVAATVVCLFVIAQGVAFGQAARETWPPPDQIMDAISEFVECHGAVLRDQYIITTRAQVGADILATA